MCVSSGSDWRRDCRAVSSITCMATPCTVAVVASTGNIISCSKSDFSIDLNVETLCPSQVRLYMRKAWDITLVATQALVNLLPQQIMPTHNAGVYLFALREIEIYQTSCCKAKAKRFLKYLKSVAKIGILPEKTGNITKKAIGKIPIAFLFESRLYVILFSTGRTWFALCLWMWYIFPNGWNRIIEVERPSWRKNRIRPILQVHLSQGCVWLSRRLCRVSAWLCLVIWAGRVPARWCGSALSCSLLLNTNIGF